MYLPIKLKDHIKLTDFGWANQIKEGSHLQYTVPYGTVEYNAPETINEENHNQQVDVWAIGILLYELCKGSTPFKSANEIITKEKIKKGEYTIPKHFSSSLSQLIKQTLQKKADDRPSIDDILKSDWILQNTRDDESQESETHQKRGKNKFGFFQF